MVQKLGAELIIQQKMQEKKRGRPLGTKKYPYRLQPVCISEKMNEEIQKLMRQRDYLHTESDVIRFLLETGLFYQNDYRLVQHNQLDEDRINDPRSGQR